MKIKATGDLFTVDARGLLRSRSFELSKNEKRLWTSYGLSDTTFFAR